MSSSPPHEATLTSRSELHAPCYSVAMASSSIETDSYLLAIPNEVLLDIVKKAQDESLGKLACTCRALNSVTCDESIWRKRCTARWHRPAQALYQKARGANVSTEWRDMYIENNGWGARPLRHSLLSTSDDFHCMEVSPLAGALWSKSFWLGVALQCCAH